MSSGARRLRYLPRVAPEEPTLSVAVSWGTRPDERARRFPCDELAPAEAVPLWRGVTVRAPAEVAFRWLCQLRAAPYSYDWIDNLGRRSPRELTPGLEQLAVGQAVMIFRLASFEWGRQLTLVTPPGGRGERVFGRVWISYCTVPEAPGCRLLAKLRLVPPPGLHGRLLAALLPWGDLVMMRKQLLTLARLAQTRGAA
jgi:hypothetical protein